MHCFQRLQEGMQNPRWWSWGWGCDLVTSSEKLKLVQQVHSGHQEGRCLAKVVHPGFSSFTLLKRALVWLTAWQVDNFKLIFLVLLLFSAYLLFTVTLWVLLTTDSITFWSFGLKRCWKCWLIESVSQVGNLSWKYLLTTAVYFLSINRTGTHLEPFLT